jgi:hypothetical protein
LRELLEQLILSHATGQIPEDIPDRDASSPDAGLPEPDGGIDADALEEAHARKCTAVETYTAKLMRCSPKRTGASEGRLASCCAWSIAAAHRNCWSSSQRSALVVWFSVFFSQK